MRTNTHTAAAVDRLAELRAEKARIDAEVKAAEEHLKSWGVGIFEGTEHTVKVVHSVRKTTAWKHVAEELECRKYPWIIEDNTSESDVVSLRITGKAKQAA